MKYEGEFGHGIDLPDRLPSTPKALHVMSITITPERGVDGPRLLHVVTLFGLWV